MVSVERPKPTPSPRNRTITQQHCFTFKTEFVTGFVKKNGAFFSRHSFVCNCDVIVRNALCYQVGADG